MVKFSQEGCQHIFLSLEHGHLLPAVNSGPDKSVPPLLANHRRSCFSDLLDAALGGLVVCCKSDLQKEQNLGVLRQRFLAPPPSPLLTVPPTILVLPRRTWTCV